MSRHDEFIRQQVDELLLAQAKAKRLRGERLTLDEREILRWYDPPPPSPPLSADEKLRRSVKTPFVLFPVSEEFMAKIAANPESISIYVKGKNGVVSVERVQDRGGWVMTLRRGWNGDDGQWRSEKYELPKAKETA